ncbi:DUF4363 family protein [Ethanoligenens sp.]|uniref:DUF4363 family protein n=1 Tax=Ethanoligenens sp. TaxID=2099655 RepID=UPI0039E945B3
MNKLKIAGIISVLIIAVMIASQIYLAKSSQCMAKSIAAVQSSYKQSGNSPATQKKMRQFFSLWQKNSRILPTILKHSELDIVNESVAKLPAYLKDDQPSDFDAECDMLKMQLIHLWNVEKINWENIL